MKQTLRAPIQATEREVSDVFIVQILSEVENAFKDSGLLQSGFGELQFTLRRENLIGFSSRKTLSTIRTLKLIFQF
jgi:hypothetical protein